MNFTIFHYSVSVRGTLIILLSVILLGTVFIVFDILPPSSIIFHNNNIARRIGLGNIPGKCTKRTKIVFLKTHKVRKGYLVCDLIYIISCYLLQPGYLHCQAQPKPKPANFQLGAEIALISQLSWTPHHPPRIVVLSSSGYPQSQQLASSYNLS